MPQPEQHGLSRAELVACLRWKHEAPPRDDRGLVAAWVSQIVYLLEFEPTWFPEFGFAIGAIGWSLGALLTDDMVVNGWAWLLPCMAMALGIVRSFVLLRLWYAARVVLTSLSALLVAYLWWSLAGRFGVVPLMGWLSGIFIIELLTAAKFSIPCARELRDEYLARRHA